MLSTHLIGKPLDLTSFSNPLDASASGSESVSSLAIERICQMSSTSNSINLYTSAIQKIAPQLSEQSIQKIYLYITSNKDSLLARVKEKREDLYIRPKESKLARAIQIGYDGRVFLHLNRKKEGDTILGEGAFKIVKTALDLETFEEFASVGFKKISNPIYSTDREVANLERLKGVPGFAQLVAKAKYPHVAGSRSPLKERVILVKYKTTLSKAIEDGILKEDDKKKIFEILVRSIHHIHSISTLHRDLKPANILLDHENQPVIADFGTMCHTNEFYKLRHNRTTSWYTSPEYAQAMIEVPFSEDKLQAATRKPLDIWSLGCVLYKLLGMNNTHGNLPWRRSTNDKTFATLATLQIEWLAEPRRNSPEHVVWEMLRSDNIPKFPKTRITAQTAMARLKNLEW